MGLATVKTDIPGFDALLGGGIPKGSTLLLSGPAGAGKTVMALQYTFNQARKGGRVLFVSTHELLYSINKFASTMTFFNLDLVRTGVNLDYYGPREEGGFVEFWDYSLGTIMEGELSGDIFDIIQERVNSHRIDHLVIDSISSIHMFLGSDVERRRKLMLFMGWASRSGCTTIFTAECDGVERMLVDAIVDLSRQEIGTPGGADIPLKTIEVVKLRGQEHSFGRYLYDISKDGITMLAPGTGSPPGPEAARTGIAGLDENIVGMPYGSVWHFVVREETLHRPLMDTMIRETVASGDGLVYAASPTDDFSMEGFRKRFGSEIELKGRIAIVDNFGLAVADDLKEFVVTGEKDKHDLVTMSPKHSLVKGKRLRIIADVASLEKSLGAREARRTIDYVLGKARENGDLAIIFSGPSYDEALSSEISASSDGVVDVWNYGGYALLRVRKAPYAKSFEPYIARLEKGQISLRPI